MQDRFDVVVVGAGAAGIAALSRLTTAGIDALALEARSHIGGRAHTWIPREGLALDCGGGWLHSADENPLVPLIETAGFSIDRTAPPWERQAFDIEFPAGEQRAFREAFAAFDKAVEAAAHAGREQPACDLLPADGRWNALLNAVSTYYNGVEFDGLSVLDYAAYRDTDVNWRVVQGYGTAIAALAGRSRIVTDCPVRSIDHGGREVRLTTDRGVLAARAVVLAVPTPHLAEGRISVIPALPHKAEAAASLPLGLADKAFLSLETPEVFPADGHLFGRTDRTETGSYHLRPFGKPYVEVYLGGRLARGLEAEGPGAQQAFAIEELVALLGSEIRRALGRIGETRWGADPWSLGSYSHALPGGSGARAVLAAPVDGRLFFAGEATSQDSYSTVHGAWRSGLRAADEAIGALQASSSGAS